MTKKERIILFLLAALNFTHILDFMIMMPLSNYLMPYFHIGAQQFSILVASYSISACVSGLVVAMVIDRFDRKKALIFAYIGFMLGTIACGLAPSYALLLTARILAGLFGGILGAQALSIVADLFTYERRGRAMGAVMSAFAAASILGVPISLYLTNLFKFDWHVPFLAIGLVGTLLIPFMIAYLPSMTGHIREGEQTIRFDAIRNVVENKDQRAALLFSGLLMMGHFLIIPFINPYLEFNKGFSKDNIPLIYLSGGIASFLSAIFLGRFSDKAGKLPVFLWSVFFSLFMVMIITGMPNVHFAIILCFFAVWFMLATSRAVTAQAMISEVVSSEQRGSFMSVNGSVQQLGSGIASLAAGAIVFTDKTSGKIMHYNWVGYLSIVVLFSTMVIGRMIFKKIDR